jgi:hypothetical protein
MEIFQVLNNIILFVVVKCERCNNFYIYNQIMLTKVMIHLRDELLIIRSNLLLLYDSNDSIGFVDGKSTNYDFLSIKK